MSLLDKLDDCYRKHFDCEDYDCIYYRDCEGRAKDEAI